MRRSVGMRLFVVVIVVAASACGGRQEPECFECGLTEEWARAEKERERQAIADRKQRLLDIGAAVAEGEGTEGTSPGNGASLILSVIDDQSGETVFLDRLISSLKSECRAQSRLTLAWAIASLRRRKHLEPRALEAFVLIAASRGKDALPELESCDPPLEPSCAAARKKIAAGETC